MLQLIPGLLIISPTQIKTFYAFIFILQVSRLSCTIRYMLLSKLTNLDSHFFITFKYGTVHLSNWRSSNRLFIKWEKPGIKWSPNYGIKQFLTTWTVASTLQEDNYGKTTKKKQKRKNLSMQIRKSWCTKGIILAWDKLKTNLRHMLLI